MVAMAAAVHVKPIFEELAMMLRETSERRLAVIVEGRKDNAALEKLGISGNHVFVLSKKPLFVIAEAVASDYRTAVILTDLDSEGKKIYGKLNTLLQRLGVKVDNSLRNFLFKNTRLRQIEGITRIFL